MNRLLHYPLSRLPPFLSSLKSLSRVTDIFKLHFLPFLLPTPMLLEQKRFVIKGNSKGYRQQLGRMRSYWINMVHLPGNLQKNTFMIMKQRFIIE